MDCSLRVGRLGARKRAANEMMHEAALLLRHRHNVVVEERGSEASAVERRHLKRTMLYENRCRRTGEGEEKDGDTREQANHTYTPT